MTFLVLVQPFHHGAGVTTCAMGPEPCTSPVSFSFPSSFISHPLLPFTPFWPFVKPGVGSFRLSHSFTPTLSSILLFSLLSHAHSCSPGLGVGGVWGLREGVRRPLAVSNARLRINSILNSVTRRGTFIGNSAGVLGTSIQRLTFSAPDACARLALVYNGINSSIDHWRGRHDAAGSMVAGALTGAIYKSTGGCFLSRSPNLPTHISNPAGVKPALAAATFVSGLAGIWSFLKQTV